MANTQTPQEKAAERNRLAREYKKQYENYHEQVEIYTNSLSSLETIKAQAESIQEKICSVDEMLEAITELCSSGALIIDGDVPLDNSVCEVGKYTSNTKTNIDTLLGDIETLKFELQEKLKRNNASYTYYLSLYNSIK